MPLQPANAPTVPTMAPRRDGGLLATHDPAAVHRPAPPPPFLPNGSPWRGSGGRAPWRLIHVGSETRLPVPLAIRAARGYQATPQQLADRPRPTNLRRPPPRRGPAPAGWLRELGLPGPPGVGFELGPGGEGEMAQLVTGLGHRFGTFLAREQRSR